MCLYFQFVLYIYVYICICSCIVMSLDFGMHEQQSRTGILLFASYKNHLYLSPIFEFVFVFVTNTNMGICICIFIWGMHQLDWNAACRFLSKPSNAPRLDQRDPWYSNAPRLDVGQASHTLLDFSSENIYGHPYCFIHGQQ